MDLHLITGAIMPVLPTILNQFDKRVVSGRYFLQCPPFKSVLPPCMLESGLFELDLGYMADPVMMHYARPLDCRQGRMMRFTLLSSVQMPWKPQSVTWPAAQKSCCLSGFAGKST